MVCQLFVSLVNPMTLHQWVEQKFLRMKHHLIKTALLILSSLRRSNDDEGTHLVPENRDLKRVKYLEMAHLIFIWNYSSKLTKIYLIYMPFEVYVPFPRSSAPSLSFPSVKRTPTCWKKSNRSTPLLSWWPCSPWLCPWWWWSCIFRAIRLKALRIASRSFNDVSP